MRVQHPNCLVVMCPQICPARRSDAIFVVHAELLLSIFLAGAMGKRVAYTKLALFYYDFS